MVRIGHEETRRLLLRDNDPAKPAPEVTSPTATPWKFEVSASSWPGTAPILARQHHPHFPDHDALMLIDIVNAGWVPIYNLNLSEDVPGYLQAPATALFTPGRMASAATWAGSAPATTSACASSTSPTSSRRQEALGTVDPTPYFVRYGENVWAAVKGYLDELTDRAAKPVIAEYMPACWPPPTWRCSPPPTTFMILQSMRLDLGPSAPVHP